MDYWTKQVELLKHVETSSLLKRIQKTQEFVATLRPNSSKETLDVWGNYLEHMKAEYASRIGKKLLR